MDDWVMRCVGVAFMGASDHMVGQWLKAFDPDMNDGRGWAEWTNDVRFARRFPSSSAGLHVYQQVSTVKPVRADGKPNRPLTSYHIELVRLCQTDDHATAV